MGADIVHWWRGPHRNPDLTPKEQQHAEDIAGRYAPLTVLIALGIVLLCVALMWIAGVL